MKCSGGVCTLIAMLLLSGCHLIFQYEDNPPDGAPAEDMRRDGVADGKQALDKKAPPDSKPLPDLKPVPDKRPVPDKQLVPDSGCPTGMKQCGKVCVDTNTDKSNCGTCGFSCDASSADRCILGKCVCGPGALACTSLLNCDQGTCRCLAGGRCKLGCCSNNVCHLYNKQDKISCGKNGAKCQPCNDFQMCTSDSCVLGQCKYKSLTDGTTCSEGGISGQCLSGQCCTGCLVKLTSGSATCTPFSSQTDNRCGAQAAECISCPYSGTNSCLKGVCNKANGTCTVGNKPNNSTCQTATGNKAGTCRNGICCSGCWTNQITSLCKHDLSLSAQYCGNAGAKCAACPAGKECCSGVCTPAPGGLCP